MRLFRKRKETGTAGSRGDQIIAYRYDGSYPEHQHTSTCYFCKTKHTLPLSDWVIVLKNSGAKMGCIDAAMRRKDVLVKSTQGRKGGESNDNAQ